jgi:uncharacterized SAM-binding protein YcdF (DUF218 family)
VETLRAAVKNLLVPGSTLFLLFALLVGVVLLFGPPRAAKWGRRWLVFLLGAHALLSLQGVSDLLAAGLSHGYRQIQRREDAMGAQVIVVLSNGAIRIDLPVGGLGLLNVPSAYNALEAARVYKLLGNPIVVASGGPLIEPRSASEGLALATALEQLGVPKDRIVLENTSWTTRSQAVNTVAWLRAHQQERFVLVTSPEHMRRAAGLFTKLGLPPIPSVSGVQYGGTPFWRPTEYALRGSTLAVYEYVAWGFYRARGWL